MKITLKNVCIRDIVDRYSDKGEEGVIGYGGRLNIRPAFQREFIYSDKERDAVIRTIRSGFPLNTMYWSLSSDGTFELMDGQQRTISFCQYITEAISVNFQDQRLAFANLTDDQQAQILDYELSIYVCEGTESEKLDWFKTINIAGKPLANQELLNALHTGSWLTDAKRWFSKTGCPAYSIGGGYLKGTAIRQDYLEKSLDWISGDEIEHYMNVHQHDKDAQELWQFFQATIDWVERVFPNYRPQMKGLEWGVFYKTYKDKFFNASEIETQIEELMQNDEVTNKKGIYEYLLSGDARTLNLRRFDERTATKKYEEQKGICPICGESFTREEMQADHITPWNKGGKTNYENCQMLCRKDNQAKSGG